MKYHPIDPAEIKVKADPFQWLAREPDKTEQFKTLLRRYEIQTRGIADKSTDGAALDDSGEAHEALLGYANDQSEDGSEGQKPWEGHKYYHCVDEDVDFSLKS